MMVKKDRSFQITSHIVLTLISLFCLVPVFILFSSSLSNEKDILTDGYMLVPRNIDLTAFRYIFGMNGSILRSYGISAGITIVGTIVSLLITLLYAYPISRPDLRGRSVFSFLLFFTILFNGGFIPTYMMWTQTFHIKNSYLAYILPNLLMNGFFAIMAKNFFSANIPMSLIESAKIDGAGEFRILYSIVMPMSKPIISTLGIFVALNYWNDWQNGLYYISNDKMYSTQVLLNRMLLDSMYAQSGLAKNMGASIGNTLPSATLKMAIASMGVVPVLIVFPFASRFLTGGIVIGAVKG